MKKFQSPHVIGNATDDNNFQGSVWEALKHCADKDNSETALWQQAEFTNALSNVENAKKSMAVLKKHLPKQYHSAIRFAQPNTIWYLNVEKGVVAAQLNRLLDNLLLRIAADIGYAPKIKVMVHPTQWQQSGFSLTHFDAAKQRLPSDKEADEIIASILKSQSPADCDL